jgi:osmotically-inducible protein OsmY
MTLSHFTSLSTNRILHAALVVVLAGSLAAPMLRASSSASALDSPASSSASALDSPASSSASALDSPASSSASASDSPAQKHADDDEIYDQVNRKLNNDADIHGRIKIEVKDAVVTLSGNVGTDKVRSKAEKIARKVQGVKEVVNKLEVGEDIPK